MSGAGAGRGDLVELSPRSETDEHLTDAAELTVDDGEEESDLRVKVREEEGGKLGEVGERTRKRKEGRKRWIRKGRTREDSTSLPSSGKGFSNGSLQTSVTVRDSLNST